MIQHSQGSGRRFLYGCGTVEKDQKKGLSLPDSTSRVCKESTLPLKESFSWYTVEVLVPDMQEVAARVRGGHVTARTRIGVQLGRLIDTVRRSRKEAG